MPIHDWTRAEAGDFHHFHQTWIPLLAAALNDGGLPPEFMALAEQVTGRPISDVVTLEARSPRGSARGVALAGAPAPSARVIQKFERINYAKRAESVGVGDRLPAIPLFLTEYDYVPCPLDATYEQAWRVFPAMLKEILEPSGRME